MPLSISFTCSNAHASFVIVINQVNFVSQQAGNQPQQVKGYKYNRANNSQLQLDNNT